MIKNFFNVAGFDAVKRIAEWIRHKFYTKAEINDMLSAGMKYEVVDELPSTGVEGTIYLVPSSTSPSGDIYDEYIYVDGDFEKIGTTKADLASVVRVPTAGTAVGDTTHPVYVDADGEATAGSQYAGGTKLTLNGTDKGADSATAYAPTAGGTAGQWLKSAGSGNTPTWENFDTTPTANSTNPVTSGGLKTALDGKQASVTITTNANTPTDNDTVIMQDNGNTSTTSFIRRKLSTLWNYIKGKDGYPEARLAWGGKHQTNATSPIDAALIPDLSANRAAFINPDCVDVLYSEDGGVTWQNYGLTDWEKQRLLCDERSVIVGKRSSSQHADAQCLLRVLIHDTTSYFYAKIQKIAVYCATNGSEGCYCNVTGRKQVDINNNVDSWDTLADHVSMSGWSGWNIIQTSFITYGGDATSYHINNYYGQIRLDFGISGPTASDNGAGLSISRIRMYGTECWGGSMSYLAKYGNPFVLREGKKCVFEGPIAVKDGTASQVLLANGNTASLPLSTANGGTGQTTAQNACNALINALSTGNSTPVDADYYVCQYAGGGTTTKTYHRRPMSALWTYIKGKISTVLGIQEGTIDGKVNLQPDFTAQQMSYSAGNVGKWQKVLRFPAGVDLVLNVKKTAMGNDLPTTIWFSSAEMGDSFTSLYSTSVRFIHESDYIFLCLKCKKASAEPTETYAIQVVHSSVPRSDIAEVTGASPISADPAEPRIVYQTPMTTGAVSFNVNSSGAGSVNMSGHNDFLGNMTAEASDGVVVTMNGATEGQIYRFVFTRNIEGGVTFKQSNVAYCTISGDVNAGDTITLTAVSNTENGWLYEQESAGIKSSDGSINVEYEGSTADLSLNLPPDVVKNNAYYSRNSHLAMALGERATCDTSSGAIAVGTDSEGGNSSVAVGYEAKASNTYCVAVGYKAGATAGYSTAVGRSATASSMGSCANGYQANAKGSYSTANGYNSQATGNYSTAYGNRAIAGYQSGDSTYPRYVVKRFTAVDFEEGGETKKYKFVDYGDSATITLNGSSVILIPPNTNCKFFIIVNDSVASRIFRSIISYARVNGEDTYINNMGGNDIVANAVIGDSYYALWLCGSPSNFPSTVDTFSFLAYYTGTDSSNYQTAIGAEATAIYGNSIAIGAEARAVKQGQTVIGSGAIPNEDDMVIFGNGSGSDNTKKNILRIDSNERMVINAGYVGGTQTINMRQQTGSLSNITKSVYKINWDGTGTVTLTLSASGCVEGQRVTIYAETNDVQIFATNIVIPQGRFVDFMLLSGAWRPMMGY